MVVTVNDIPEAPIVSGSTCSVDENKPDDAFVCQVSAVNTEDDVALDFTILSGNTNDAFKINSCSGIIFVKTGSELNFEGGTTQYTLRIKITGGISTEIDQIINVNDVPEAPTISSASLTVVENTVAGTLLTAMSNHYSDPDAGETVTFSLLDGNVNNVWTIDAATRKFNANKLVDFEARSSYNVLIRATDKDGLTGDGTFAITVTDVNEPPVYAEGTTFNRNLNENPSGNVPIGVPMLATDPDAGLEGNLTYSIVSGNTGTAFSVDASTGQLRVAQASLIDRERSGGFTFTLGVRARDISSSPQQTDASVTLTINDVNEPPSIKSDTCSSANNLGVDEESPINTNIGTSPLAPLSLCVKDIDVGASHTYTLLGSKTHSISAAHVSSASENSVSGDWTISLSTPTTLVANSGVVVKQGGLDPDQVNFPGRWVAEGSLNSSPALDGTSRSSISVFGFRGTFTTTGDLIFGEGLGNGKVTLNAATGRFQVAVSNLNHDIAPFVFIYTVRVTDNGGLSTEQDIQITIDDVNEPPEMPSALDLFREVSEAAPGSLPTFLVGDPGWEINDAMVPGSCGVFPAGGQMPVTCQYRAVCAQDQEGDALA
jgi:hypothetical protein